MKAKDVAVKLLLMKQRGELQGSEEFVSLMDDAVKCLQTMDTSPHMGQLRTNVRGDVVRLQTYGQVGGEPCAFTIHRVVGAEVESRWPLSEGEVEALYPYVVKA
jgi:hypothetical protein